MPIPVKIIVIVKVLLLLQTPALQAQDKLPLNREVVLKPGDEFQVLYFQNPSTESNSEENHFELWTFIYMGEGILHDHQTMQMNVNVYNFEFGFENNFVYPVLANRLTLNIPMFMLEQFYYYSIPSLKANFTDSAHAENADTIIYKELGNQLIPLFCQPSMLYCYLPSFPLAFESPYHLNFTIPYVKINGEVHGEKFNKPLTMDKPHIQRVKHINKNKYEIEFYLTEPGKIKYLRVGSRKINKIFLKGKAGNNTIRFKSKDMRVFYRYRIYFLVTYPDKSKDVLRIYYFHP